MSQDLYNSWERRMDTVLGNHTAKYIYWKHLREANRKYKRLFPADSDDIQKFCVWLEENYGIQTKSDPTTGYIGADHKIIDEQKYLLFTLEFEK